MSQAIGRAAGRTGSPTSGSLVSLAVLPSTPHAACQPTGSCLSGKVEYSSPAASKDGTKRSATSKAPADRTRGGMPMALMPASLAIGPLVPLVPLVPLGPLGHRELPSQIADSLADRGRAVPTPLTASA